MPHLTFPATINNLPLTILVGLDGGRVRDLQTAGLPVPPPLLLQAVIDTGSEVTVLNPGLPARAGLPLFRTTSTHTPIGTAIVNLYEAGLSIPAPSGGRGPTLAFSPLIVMEAVVALPNIDAVVGMDVLSECLLIFDGPGKQFTLAF